jgi:hypothetical protein
MGVNRPRSASEVGTVGDGHPGDDGRAKSDGEHSIGGLTVEGDDIRTLTQPSQALALVRV